MMAQLIAIAICAGLAIGLVGMAIAGAIEGAEKLKSLTRNWK